MSKLGPKIPHTCQEPDHGTPARYRQHYADGDDPCVPCQIAWRQDQCADKPVSPTFGAGGVLIDEILPDVEGTPI